MMSMIHNHYISLKCNIYSTVLVTEGKLRNMDLQLYGLVA